MPEFDVAYATLRAHHGELERVQVTHAEMHELVLSSGIDPAKVFRIPIGVDVRLFPQQTLESRAAARASSVCLSMRSSSARSRRTASAGGMATSRS